MSNGNKINTLIQNIQDVPTTKGKDHEKLIKLGQTFQSVVVDGVSSMKDIKQFLQVSVAIKKTLEKLVPTRKKVQEQLKVKVSAIEEKAAKAKELMKEGVGPYSIVEKELTRIKDEARSAVAKFAESEIAEMEKKYGDLSAAEKALAEPPTTQVIKVEGSQLSFRDGFRVDVEDLDYVPDKYVEFVPDKEAIREAIGTALEVVNHVDIEVQKTGKVVIKIKPEDFGEGSDFLVRDSVKEAKIIASEGCDGVTLIPTKIPVVKI